MERQLALCRLPGNDVFGAYSTQDPDNNGRRREAFGFWESGSEWILRHSKGGPLSSTYSKFTGRSLLRTYTTTTVVYQSVGDMPDWGPRGSGRGLCWTRGSQHPAVENRTGVCVAAGETDGWLSAGGWWEEGGGVGPLFSEPNS